MQKTAKLIQFKSTGDLGIQIRMGYNKLNLRRVNSLKGSKYHSKAKAWSCSLAPSNITKLREWKFEIDPKLNSYLEKQVPKEIKPALKIKGLGGTPYAFQWEGIEFVEEKNGRALIADEMGLGKTIMALAWLQLHPELRPAIVICTATAKYQWKREAELWLSHPNVQVVSNQDSIYADPGGLYIINYDILKSWIQDLRKLDPKVLIIDECHKIKNTKAKRTKAVKMLVKRIPHVIAMSGTPLLNRPFEIYNAVSIVDPLALPDFWEFTKKYCDRKHDGFGWDWTGSSNEMELHEILTQSVMIRRLKKDVEIQLPDKTWSYVPMELDNWMEYYQAEQDFIQYLRNRKGRKAADAAEKAEHLVKTEALKQIAVRGKIKQCISWIEDFLEVEKKLVVFCIHRNIAFELEHHFGSRAVKIVGGMTSKQKQHSMDRFQTSDDIQLFIGNMKAAGESINLTAASNVAILELPWTPGELHQAEDRCHRITQKNNVTVHFLLARDSIEEKIAGILDDKSETIKAVTDGVTLAKKSMLTELMNQYLKT